MFTVRTLLCVVCCLCHIAAHHTIGAKRLNLGFIFCPRVCGLSHFEDLIRFDKSFSVYLALEMIHDTFLCHKWDFG